MSDDETDQDEARRHDSGLPVTEKAQNAEIVIDPELEPGERDDSGEPGERGDTGEPGEAGEVGEVEGHPGRDAARHVERLERHREPTDTPAHPESPPSPEAPPPS